MGRIFLFLGIGRLQGAHIRQVGVAWTILDFKKVSDPGSSSLSLKTFWSLSFFFSPRQSLTLVGG